MKTTREEMKQECIERMEIMGVHEDSINHFKSDLLPLHRVSFDKDMDRLKVKIGVANEDLLELVRKMEEEMSCKAYLLILTETNMGDILNCLITMEDKDEWEMGHMVMELDKNVASWCFNLTLPNFSGFSIIRFANIGGVICRVL